ISIEQRIELAAEWKRAGADYLIIEAREVGHGFAMFTNFGVNNDLMVALEGIFPRERIYVEAPNRATQIGAISCLGRDINLSNVSPFDYARVETIRRCIHS